MSISSEVHPPFPGRPSSSSCSWSPPSDFDSYEVECRRHDNGELTSALRLAGGVTAVMLDHLDAYRKYSVTVRVSSAGQTSPLATHTTVTMIDRPPFPRPATCCVTGNELLQPEQRHPLTSHRDYISNSSARAYQTGTSQPLSTGHRDLH
ncbi:receptor-type tyrosine-protein phosphatase beta-like protein [Lates japonicus]|uniref:Receptor-type tyrosine-protein phosphatase beta-like protein n=1 Tax=Lates japonicus TaxID=270547 RepID=A0AAD3NLK0_LATJO|nr:receptor-type tyrosine-protein phosphatase beta-like protein [Lates japonicus]